jgi:hypothetical protein
MELAQLGWAAAVISDSGFDGSLCCCRWLGTRHFQDTADGGRSEIPGVTPAGRSQSLSQPRASHHPLQMYPLVPGLAADGIPVTVICRVLGFSKQGFYAWRKDPCSQRDWDNAHLINAAIDIHHDDPAFGYRFIADELPAHGITAGENRVARLCSQQQIWSSFAKRRGLNRRAGPPVHHGLVRRVFSANKANETWLTDITEHRTGEGKLYLCAIKDVYSNKIVGYSTDSNDRRAGRRGPA